MSKTEEFKPLSCEECLSGAGLEFDFTMAFQPFVDVATGGVFGYEALVRGPNRESAGEILAKVNDKNKYQFDQACRVKAIRLASQLGLEGVLSINFLPGAIYKPETCIRATLEAAHSLDFSTNRLMFEVSEGERVTDHSHLRDIFTEYRRRGFITAIDDFGAGYAGLNLLADFQPDYLKLDMALTRNIAKDRIRRSIVSGILVTCRELELKVIAEGIETREECLTLQDEGVTLFQGYLFSRPGFQTLPPVPPAVLELVRPRRQHDRKSRYPS
jgi:EAL domain-containing protein (putative c-di-GMP-specific phosphodiesterase class I)